MNPSQMSDASINSQITKYEEFIDVVLKGDLQRIMNNYESICERVVEYTNIKSTIKTIQDNKGGPFKTMSDIGSNCYVKCVVWVFAVNLLIKLVYIWFFFLDQRATWSSWMWASITLLNWR